MCSLTKSTIINLAISIIMWLISSFNSGMKHIDHDAAVAVGQEIYYFGGLRQEYNPGQFTAMDVHVMNTRNFRWTEHPVSELPCFQRGDILPGKKFGYTAVVYGKKVFIWGGLNESFILEHHDAEGNIASAYDPGLFCFDIETFRWTVPETTGDIPLPRHGHTACIWQQYMYIYGGHEEGPTHSEHVYALDLDKMKWMKIITQGGSQPQLRAYHTAVCLGDRMYVYGGHSWCPLSGIDTMCTDRLWHLDLLTNRWQHIRSKNTPTARWRHSAFVHEEKMFIHGGYSLRGGQYFIDTSTYHFDPKTTSWTRMHCKGRKPCKKRGQRCVIVEDRMFLIGGESVNRSDSTPPTTGKTHRLAADHDSDTYVVDLKPTLKTLCMMAVRRHKLDTSDLPLTLRTAMTDMFTPKKITVSRPNNNIIR